MGRSLEITERSVDKDYVSTYNVSEGNILRKHHLSAEPHIRRRQATCDYIVIKVELFEHPIIDNIVSQGTDEYFSRVIQRARRRVEVGGQSYWKMVWEALFSSILEQDVREKRRSAIKTLPVGIMKQARLVQTAAWNLGGTT